ncbi:glycine oxidase ThiO [Bacillus solimangrovi]|uniref:glycine oxidase n=1 Tax=Bacillus solimangrovi TaxID=1305675 RepID=A0A1E5LFV9_9BACI|nr:glycine oxidase ThiO [Bacillus solimangrovi]OEH92953.1 glycine oxidase ThiO [Bacillus solimangrovi]
MLKKYEVIIVGGGVIGCSIAFYLSKAGKKVLLLEKDQIGLKSSSAAAGMLGVQAELKEFSPIYPLARRSALLFPDLHQELKELTGIDIGYRVNGAMKPALSDDEFAQFSKTAAWQQAQGETAQMLSTSDTLSLEPSLSESIKGAIYFPNEAQVSPYPLVRAFAMGAIRYGAKIEEAQEVLEVVRDGQEVTSVITSNGSYKADHVVVATGVWGNNPAISHSNNLELYPLKGEALSLKVSTPILHTTVFTESCYLTPKTADEIYIGATEKPYCYDTTPTVNGIHQLLNTAKCLLPALGEAKIDRMWAGLRPTTPDHMPYISKAPNIDNLWYAFGHHRNGILLSAITGEIITSFIDGEEYDLDLTAFTPKEIMHRR